MATADYGRFYWCIKVPSNISPDGEIYLHADKVEVTPNGDLLFWNSINEKNKKPFQNLALARGSWLVFFAASIIDGGAVAVEHWESVVSRSN